jgi:hypothetical protein
LANSTCVPCNSFANVINKYNGNNDCQCAPGWVWSSALVSCITCNDTDNTGCQVSSCAGFFWSGSACTACSSASSTNNYVLSTAGSCICLPGYSWTVTACTLCSDPSITTAQCQQSSCSSYVWNNVSTSCGDCTGITDVSSTTPVNGQCICNIGSYWDPTASQCLACSDATQTDCKKKCTGYLWQQELCQTCLSINYTDTSFNKYAVNGACICQQNFIWDPTTLSCLDCSTATSSAKCGSGTCLHYFWIPKAGSNPLKVTCSPCSAIPNAMPRQPSDAANTCSCSYGNIWSSVSNQCVACNLL